MPLLPHIVIAVFFVFVLFLDFLRYVRRNRTQLKHMYEKMELEAIYPKRVVYSVSYCITKYGLPVSSSESSSTASSPEYSNIKRLKSKLRNKIKSRSKISEVVKMFTADKWDKKNFKVIADDLKVTADTCVRVDLEDTIKTDYEPPPLVIES